MNFFKKANTKYQVVAAKTPKEKFMDNMVKDILAVRKSKGQELAKFEARLRKLSFDKLQDMYKKEVGKTKLEYRESGKPYILKVTAASGIIKSTEPIKIEWKIADNMMVIKIDGIDYAVIDDVTSQDQVDMHTLKDWIENTYYDGSYKSSAYTPCRLSLEDFGRG